MSTEEMPLVSDWLKHHADATRRLAQNNYKIEEPFGRDPNDLPLDVICNIMLRSVEELIRLAPSNQRSLLATIKYTHQEPILLG